MNTDIIIRTATPGDIPGMARVHVDSWRSTYRGIVPDEYLAKLAYENSEARMRRQIEDGGERLIMLVAAQGETIIGFASGGSEREGRPEFTGELYAIYLYKESQGQGIGRMLFNEMAARLRERGHESLFVWVLARNRSREFYRKMGGELVATKMIMIGGEELEEEGYGWRDLRSPLQYST